MSAPLTIGGQTRPIDFDLDAIQLVEDTLGGQPIRPLITRNRALTVTQLVVMGWALWRRDDRGLTTETVRRWIVDYCKGGGNLLLIENAFINALVEGGHVFPTPDGFVPGPTVAPAGDNGGAPTARSSGTSGP